MNMVMVAMLCVCLFFGLNYKGKDIVLDSL